MRIVSDGRNWYGLSYLISALRPEPGDPTVPADLVVTMLRGESISLRGRQAEAMMAQLAAATVPPPVGPEGQGLAGDLSYTHRVKLTEEPEEGSVIGPPENH